MNFYDFLLTFLNHSRISMIMEPLMLIAAFFIFFFFAFFYVRLDFSISKDEGQEVRLKVSGLCEKICVNQVITIIDFIIGTKIYCPIF